MLLLVKVVAASSGAEFGDFYARYDNDISLIIIIIVSSSIIIFIISSRNLVPSKEYNNNDQLVLCSICARPIISTINDVC
jgi:hypothetical protein